MTYAAELSKRNADDFFAVIDRTIRNENLEFAEICTKRSDEELMGTLRHWQGKEGRYAERQAAIVKAEINDRLGNSI